MNLQIVQRDPKTLKAYEGNSRIHPESQILELMEIIKEFGFIKPVSIGSDLTLYTGHGATQAAIRLGLKEIPTIDISHLSERQRKAFVIADNKIALKSAWDMEKLSQEVNDLVNAEFNIDLLSFDEQEIEAILKTDASLLPDEEENLGTAAAPSEEEATPKRKKAKGTIVHTCPHCSKEFSA